MESARFLIKDIMRPFSKIRTAQFVEALERRVHLSASPFNTKSVQGAWTLQQAGLTANLRDSRQALLHKSIRVPHPRNPMAATFLGDSAYLAGGGDLKGESSTIDIYGLTTKKWSTATLPHPGATVGLNIGGKLLFTGGSSGEADIYDPNTTHWTSTAVPSPSKYLIAGSTLENKAFLLSKVDTRAELDIYEVDTGLWSTVISPETPLQTISTGTGMAVVGNSLYFVSESGNLVGYNVRTARWSVISTGQPAATLIGAITAVGTRLFLGPTATNDAYVYDVATGRGVILKVPVDVPPAYGTDTIDAVASLGSKAIFESSRSGKAAVYDTRSGKWSSAPFKFQKYEGSRFSVSVATAGRRAIFAGGQGIPSPSPSFAADIYTDPSPSPALSGDISGTVGQSVSIMLRNSGDAPLSGRYTIKVYTGPGRSRKNAVLIGSLKVGAPLMAGASSQFVMPTALSQGPHGLMNHLVADVTDMAGHITTVAVDDQAS